MGRFEGLNAETQDLVKCLLPALAASFGLSDPVDIIPEDIRMRAWDCERRDHIKERTENDPRNWGVQFLKDLMAISRMKNGNLAEFQADLRAKVALHEPKHPWCRLADIKEIKDEYEHPERKNQVQDVDEESSGSSTDSYLEELVEPDDPRGRKRMRKGMHETYEARVQQPAKRKKLARLRRAEDGGYHRPEKTRKRDSCSIDLRSPTDHGPPSSGRRARQTSRTVHSDRETSIDSGRAMSLLAPHTPSFSGSPAGPAFASIPAHMHAVNTSTEPLEVQKMQAELEVAEAELRAARLKYAYIQAKEQAEREAAYADAGALPGHEEYEYE